MKRRLENLGTAFGRVFARPAYFALALVLAIVAYLLAVWLPNLGLIWQILWQPGLSISARLGVPLGLLSGIVTNFNWLSATYTISIAVLFGINTAMIAYLLRESARSVAGRGIAISTGAMASGALGVGCAACGSLLVSGVFPFLGATGALALLPLGGEEFGVLSVALLVLSLVMISRNIAAPVACPVGSQSPIQFRDQRAQRLG